MDCKHKPLGWLIGFDRRTGATHIRTHTCDHIAPCIPNNSVLHSYFYRYVLTHGTLIPMPSLTSHFTDLTARLRRGVPFNPERDWTLLLSCAGIALLLIVAWNVWAFRTVVGGGTLGAVPQAPPVPTSQTSLEAIPALLADRAAEDAKYVNGTYRFVDPSQ